MIKAIIFDLDGVIVHTDHFHYLAWKSVADNLGIYFDETINMRLRGVSRMESLDIILERYKGKLSYAERTKVATIKNNRYRELLSKMTENDVDSEVLETLKTLRDMGIKLAIGSSSKNAGFILEKTGIRDLFDAVSDGNNIKNSKPNPEVFIKASEFLQIPPEYGIVVEDAVAGIEAAKRGGFKAVAIGDAHNHPQSDYKITNLKELLDIVRSENV